jgi:hypothetical protein
VGACATEFFGNCCAWEALFCLFADDRHVYWLKIVALRPDHPGGAAVRIQRPRVAVGHLYNEKNRKLLRMGSPLLPFHERSAHQFAQNCCRATGQSKWCCCANTKAVHRRGCLLLRYFRKLLRVGRLLLAVGRPLSRNRLQIAAVRPGPMRCCCANIEAVRNRSLSPD